MFQDLSCFIFDFHKKKTPDIWSTHWLWVPFGKIIFLTLSMLPLIKGTACLNQHQTQSVALYLIKFLTCAHSLFILINNHKCMWYDLHSLNLETRTYISNTNVNQCNYYLPHFVTLLQITLCRKGEKGFLWPSNNKQIQW